MQDKFTVNLFPQTVNRQMREKEEEANESREKVKKLADQTKGYSNEIQRLQVSLQDQEAL